MNETMVKMAGFSSKNSLLEQKEINFSSIHKRIWRDLHEVLYNSPNRSDGCFVIIFLVSPLKHMWWGLIRDQLHIFHGDLTNFILKLFQIHVPALTICSVVIIPESS